MRGALLGLMVFVLAVTGGYFYGRHRKAQRIAARKAAAQLPPPKPVTLNIPALSTATAPIDLPGARDRHRGTSLPRAGE